jgi:hypothetical protein
MKIYRYLPNAHEYAVVTMTLAGKWWPDGIDLGPVMQKLFPKGSGPWAHENNRYTKYPPELPLSDFPAFALNVPLVSERAAAVLACMGFISDPVPLTVSGQPFFAVQPQELPGVFDAANSRGLTLPGGEVFHYYQRSFDPSKVTAEFFVIPALQPFSDLYITERLLREVKALGLTGLEYVELVYDDGPVVPVYPPVERERITQYSYRRRLEWELLYWRGSLRFYDEDVIRDAIEKAVSDGMISFDYVQPSYRRQASGEVPAG